MGGDGTITFEEFERSLSNKEVKEYINALQVDVTDAKLFFSLLDEDGSGSVDTEEFVKGMKKLKGDAKSFDIHMILRDNKKLLSNFRCILDHLGCDSAVSFSIGHSVNH